MKNFTRYFIGLILFFNSFAYADYATTKRITVSDLIQGSVTQENYIKDSPPKAGVTKGWSCYADAAGSVPVDGTGGSPTGVTWTATSTTPLKGPGAFVFTKSGSANKQGMGCSYNFTIDKQDRAKVLGIEAEYLVDSGTFTAGTNSTNSDIIWYIYDVTNAKLIEPSSTKFLSNSTTLSDSYKSTFQTSSDSVSYRLIAHVSTTTTNDFALKFGGISVSRSSYPTGTPITDFASYTAGCSGSWSTNTTYTCKKRQIGDSYEYVVKISLSGAPTATTLSLTIPDTIDAAKINNPAAYSAAFESSGSSIKTPTAYAVKALYETNTSVAIGFISSGTTSSLALLGHTAPVTWGTGDSINVRFSVPILGKSSSVQMSDSADTRLMTARYKTAAGQSIPNSTFTIVDFGTKDFDTHGLVTTGASWKFTSNISGYFRVSTHIRAGSALNAVNFAARIYKNGAAGPAIADSSTDNSASGRGDVTGSTIIQMVAGDYFDIRVTQNSGGAVTLLNDADYVYVDIEKLSGQSSIAASESVNAVYTTAAGQSIPNATDTIIDFGTAEINSHGNVVTGAAWKFTASISGVYEVSAFVQLNSGGGWAVSEEAVVSLFKNGSGLATLGLYSHSAANSVAVSIPCPAREVRLNAGEYIDIRINQNSGAALGLVASALRNWVSIKRVGN